MREAPDYVGRYRLLPGVYSYTFVRIRAYHHTHARVSIFHFVTYIYIYIYFIYAPGFRIKVIQQKRETFNVLYFLTRIQSSFTTKRETRERIYGMIFYDFLYNIPLLFNKFIPLEEKRLRTARRINDTVICRIPRRVYSSVVTEYADKSICIYDNASVHRVTFPLMPRQLRFNRTKRECENVGDSPPRAHIIL